MQGSQLLDLMKSLTKHDVRELRKVVRSPYFNQREDVIQLFDFIEKSLNSKSPVLIKEKVFSTLFANKKYDDVLMRQIMSYLYKIIHKYLIVEVALQSQAESQISLVKALRQKKSERIFEKYLSASNEIVETQSFRNSQFHFFKYTLLQEEYEYMSKKKRGAELNLQEVSNNLDYYYLTEKLHMACIMFAHKNISKHNYDEPLLEPVLQYVEKMNIIPTAVSAYYHIYKVLTDPDNEIHYKNLKIIITAKSDSFPETERRDLYIAATNYCIKRLNKGDKFYGKEALELYRARLDTNVLLENGILPFYTYNNMLMLALKAEEYDWAERVLHDFKQYLPEKERENIFNYNLAIFYFRTGKYPEAMMLLQKVNLNDVLYNLDARRLLARIYYETDEQNALHSLIESSKVYLHRQKDIGYHHDMYANYFRFLDKMLKIDLKRAESRAILRGEVEGTQLLAEREWLMERLK
jgi:hypothetical protein